MFDLIWIFGVTVLGSYLGGTEGAIYFGSASLAGIGLGKFIAWRNGHAHNS